MHWQTMRKTKHAKHPVLLFNYLIVSACIAGQHCATTKNKAKQIYGVMAHLLKQIPNTRSTNTNKQLHKLWGCATEERHSCLSSNGLCQKGLSCSWGSHQQTPLGDLGTKLGVLVRVLQEVNDLLKLNFGLIYTLWEKDQVSEDRVSMP